MIKQSDFRCELCYPTSDQNKLIFTTLLRYFIERQGVERPNEIIDCGGFNGLLKNVFCNKYKVYKETLTCSHLHIRNAFLNYLEISPEQLSDLSNIKLMETAKYNYHLDVVSAQSKTYYRHYNDLCPLQRAKSQENSPNKTEKPVSPPKKILLKPQPEKEQKVKVEEENPVEPVVYPLNNLSGNLNYGEGIQFGPQFTEALNNMYNLTFGLTFFPEKKQ